MTTRPLPLHKTEITQMLRYHFTAGENLENGKRLAETHTKIDQLEKDKKMAMTDFNAKISAVKAEGGSLTDKVTTGYEMREMDCEAHMDTPHDGKKTIFRKDTMEEIEVQTMTPGERSESAERKRKHEYEMANPALPLGEGQPDDSSDVGNDENE